jgi:hypothetical protein
MNDAQKLYQKATQIIEHEVLTQAESLIADLTVAALQGEFSIDTTTHLYSFLGSLINELEKRGLRVTIRPTEASDMNISFENAKE